MAQPFCRREGGGVFEIAVHVKAVELAENTAMRTAEPGIDRKVDDAATTTGLQARHGSRNAVPGAFEVDVDHVGDIGVGGLGDGCRVVHTGRVDQNVDTSERGVDLPEQGSPVNQSVNPLFFIIIFPRLRFALP